MYVPLPCAPPPPNCWQNCVSQISGGKNPLGRRSCSGTIMLDFWVGRRCSRPRSVRVELRSVCAPCHLSCRTDMPVQGKRGKGRGKPTHTPSARGRRKTKELSGRFLPGIHQPEKCGAGGPRNRICAIPSMLNLEKERPVPIQCLYLRGPLARLIE